MNIESFEKEIAQLESQLRDAVSAVQVMQEIQSTYRDMQSRYDRLKQLLDQVALLPEHYAQQLATQQQQAEARLVELENPIRQQQAQLLDMLTQHQQQVDARLAAMDSKIQAQKGERDTMFTRHERVHQELHQTLAKQTQAIEQSKARSQKMKAVLEQRLSDIDAELRTVMNQALEDQARELWVKSKAQSNKALITGLLAGVIALGAWYYILLW